MGSEEHLHPMPSLFRRVLDRVPKSKELKRMRALALFGDSITTDHISPAGAFKADTPAGKYLDQLGIKEAISTATAVAAAITTS